MKKDFSVVIPVLNEEESLRELVAQIKEAFEPLKKSYEIIFIDDGSTDESLEVLKLLARETKNIRIFAFRRNLGKSPALTFGFQEADGEYILTLDADLQDDPSNLSSMVIKMKKDNLDLVTGWRKERRDTPFKIATSKIFNSLVSLMFGLKLHDLNSGLKLFKSELAKELHIYGGMHRFIPIIATEMGYRVGEKDIIHHARKYGYSKYKFTKVFTDIPDLITIYFLTKYNRRPLHFFGQIGSFIFGVGGIALTYLLVLRIMGQTIGDRPLLLFGVLLVLIGFQIILTGLIADLLVNQNERTRSDFPLKFKS